MKLKTPAMHLGFLKSVLFSIILLLGFSFTRSSSFSFAQEDEFKTMTEEEIQGKAIGEGDDFKEFTGDRSKVIEGIGSGKGEGKGCNDRCRTNCRHKSNSALFWVLGILGFTMLTGFLVRFRSTRNLRGMILIASVVILGFYLSACPCPISSFQDVFLGIIHNNFSWRASLYFLGLIPITYFFGKVWCGWVCHLGALQELLFHPGRFEILKSDHAQKILRIVRYAALAGLIIQLFITRSNLFCKIDPFLVAFNLRSAYLAGWILLGIVIISSVFIHRPFCRTVCPIGVTLGWVSKIPGAAVIRFNNDNCSECNKCHSVCTVKAIRKQSPDIKTEECIACGECISECRKMGIGFN